MIAAISGRSLAAAARRAGLRPLVADLFNDTDTMSFAERAIRLPGSIQTGIEADGLMGRLVELAGDDAPQAVIYGSGFERTPDMVDAIARHFFVAGNTARTIRAVKNPARLADLCTSLSIPHPEISSERPDNLEGWLVKLAGGAGGSHVGHASGGDNRPDRYFQRFVAGRNVSALFIADGREARLIGFSRQWVAPSQSSPYRYGGAVRLMRYSKKNRAQIGEWLIALTARTGLVGLCAADFIDGPSGLWLIEINPRPGATLDIFDSDETPLLREHLNAVRGAGAKRPTYAGSVASAIAYTPHPIRIFPPIEWPELTADHQPPGSVLDAGDPVCTVFASARSAATAERAVKNRVKALAAYWKEASPWGTGSPGGTVI
ncbi:ATP-grasp domain-containing protein [Phyllobacterium salinisoli]|uniref:ATP-grasp domain-containing protein n=1 Tax=Phyllobacterium salinisoli TaxID=1899321 RepID=A0A368K840_9HYPH|nr:ATP-grasp domain-containing protein [Phyllobacterium salinisoli]